SGDRASRTTFASWACYEAPSRAPTTAAPSSHSIMADMKTKRRLDRSEALRDRAQRLIPAGAHTYSKGDDQFPANAPGFIVRGSGARVWDPDGNEYVDWAMGLRAVRLGHADPRVVAAATRQLG